MKENDGMETSQLLLKSGMHRLSQEEVCKLKMIVLDMYKDILDYCTENHICFMLGGGSALGAVRHKGFIPWDDDMDINMPREDYNRFVEGFEKKYGDKYELYVPDGIHKVICLFTKVCLKGTILDDYVTAGMKHHMGVNIDVFPMEYVPDHALIRKVKGITSDILSFCAVSTCLYQNRNKYMDEVYSSSSRAKAQYRFRRLIGMILSPIGYEKLYVMFDKFVQHRKKTKYVTFPTGRAHYAGELHESASMLPPCKCTFEGYKAFIPRDYRKYLRALYGKDYMQLPPEEKREHHFVVRMKLNT